MNELRALERGGGSSRRGKERVNSERGLMSRLIGPAPRAADARAHTHSRRSIMAAPREALCRSAAGARLVALLDEHLPPAGPAAAGKAAILSAAAALLEEATAAGACHGG